MLGTHRRSEPSDRALAVAMMNGGLSPQTVTQVTGVHAHSLLHMVAAGPRHRTEYAPPPRPVVRTVAVRDPLRFLPPPPEPFGWHGILQQVAEKHGLTVADLLSTRAIRALSWPRQEAMARLRKERGLTTTQIARFLHRTDHTTVLHGIRQHETRMLWADILIAAGRACRNP